MPSLEERIENSLRKILGMEKKSGEIEAVSNNSSPVAVEGSAPIEATVVETPAVPTPVAETAAPEASPVAPAQPVVQTAAPVATQTTEQVVASNVPDANAAQFDAINARFDQLAAQLSNQAANPQTGNLILSANQPAMIHTVRNPITGAGGFYMGGNPRVGDYKDSHGDFGYLQMNRRQSQESRLYLQSGGQKGSLRELNQIEAAFVENEAFFKNTRNFSMCAGMDCNTIDVKTLNQELGACVTLLFSDMLYREYEMTPLADCFSIVENVVDQVAFIEALTKSVIQNWTCGFNPKENIFDFAVHKGKVHAGKVDVCWCLQDFAKTYFHRLMSSGFTPWNYSFSQFLLELLMKQVMKDLHQAIIQGEHDPSVAGTPAANNLTWTDGFLHIAQDILNTGFAPVPTGPVNAPGTQYNTLQMMVDAISPEYQYQDMILYGSPLYYKNLVRDLKDRHMHASCCQEGSIKNSLVKNINLDEGSITVCTPSFWNSNRLILAPKWNMQILFDLFSDFTRVRIQQHYRQEAVMLDFKAGANIAYAHPDVLAINNAA